MNSVVALAILVILDPGISSAQCPQCGDVNFVLALRFWAKIAILIVWDKSYWSVELCLYSSILV